MLNGVFAVRKAAGWTSADVVRKLKGTLATHLRATAAEEAAEEEVAAKATEEEMAADAAEEEVASKAPEAEVAAETEVAAEEEMTVDSAEAA